MNAGFDPFNDEDPIAVYQKIVKCKVKFPKQFDKESKSLIKHILVLDPSKRLGELKNGANDIKEHKYFDVIDKAGVLSKKLPAVLKPPKYKMI